jgi:hypothetical protein
LIERKRKQASEKPEGISRWWRAACNSVSEINSPRSTPPHATAPSTHIAIRSSAALKKPFGKKRAEEPEVSIVVTYLLSSQSKQT